MEVPRCPPKSTETLVQQLNMLRSELTSVDSPESPGELYFGEEESPEQKAQKQKDRMKDKEAAALRALLEAMVQTFRDTAVGARLPYFLEAAAISPYVSDGGYEQLFIAVVDALGSGVSDGTVPDVQLLAAFNTILQHPRDLENLPLKYTLPVLIKRLSMAVDTASDSMKYQLILTLSAALDAMNDIKVSGIGETNVVEPLIKLLGKVSEQKDLRLAQAARYAQEALRVIPTDVNPWKTVLGSAYKVVKGAAKIAGSASTLDPLKLLEGLESIAEVAESMVKAIKVMDSLTGFARDFSGMVKGAKYAKKPAKWYAALRYTELLIRGRHLQILELLLNDPKFPCREDKHFLRGLCAQFERALESKNLAKDNEVATVLTTFLSSQYETTTDKAVREWVHVVVDTAALDSRKRGLHLRRKDKPPVYTAATKYQQVCTKQSGRALLNEAWKNCQEALVFYADEAIRSRYTDEKVPLLKIERLGGSSLPMDKCYINLTISERNDNEKKTRDGDGYESRFYLSYETAPKTGVVLLPDLFQKRPSGSSRSGMLYF